MELPLGVRVVGNGGNGTGRAYSHYTGAVPSCHCAGRANNGHHFPFAVAAGCIFPLHASAQRISASASLAPPNSGANGGHAGGSTAQRGTPRATRPLS
eukprot:1151043-Lingulodinium_polyedra.AAC.1